MVFVFAFVTQLGAPLIAASIFRHENNLPAFSLRNRHSTRYLDPEEHFPALYSPLLKYDDTFETEPHISPNLPLNLLPQSLLGLQYPNLDHHEGAYLGGATLTTVTRT
jgi:hypothetical protein